ncbi:PREDICTED: plant UBX domain-containing protein 8-like isoform X2 [Lupinus angustifolius]|uniref:plant UBX domain-containing protein 8-like isoform X2 n=1 Tax=Lupinus angustifolius TaxID=3871 RepID=UPI00092E9FF3|nr:PREDICTED: plant UBX domain-containing protein 8-like isoform X2 [Lupinus angustifolius]
MATRLNQEAIETFISITGASEQLALQKLEEHGGNLNEAINAHFSEGDRTLMTSTHETSTPVPQDDFMDTDDQLDDEIHTRPPLFARNLNPFCPVDPTIGGSIFGTHLGSINRAPFVTHPREVREIPIEVKDGNQSTPQAGHVPIIEDVTGYVLAHGPDIHGTVIVNDEDDDGTSRAQTAHWDDQRHNKILADTSLDSSVRPSAPEFENLPDHSNDVEEEMIRAAIEASKREADENYRNHQLGRQLVLSESGPKPKQSYLEDPELAHAVSLSLKAAEQEKARHVQGGDFGAPTSGSSKSSEVELRKMASNKKFQEGCSSFQDEAEDVEEQPQVRNKTRRIPLGSTGLAREDEVIEVDTLPSIGQESSYPPQHNENSFHTDEWGGISSEEHDEAVMLEAAIFGGIPEGSYRHASAPHEFMQGRGFNPRPTYRPPSPSLTAQRLIKEQQDDEYLASLQADRDKELKAIEEAEAAREEERRRAEESRRKLEEEQESETRLAAKEVSLPPEPSSDDDKVVTLLVRMPDGNRRGRRFRRSDNLQALFDFIDIGRVVKPGSYRLVRPYPRRVFSNGESASTLEELGLINKQEALFLEII